MKPQPVSRTVYQNSSFMLENHYYKNFLKVWHYHPELELVVILESTGTRFAGDSIEKFEAGEIVLIGENLPHLWLNDKIYFDGKAGLQAKAHVIHFHKSFAQGLSNIPEMSGICNLFKRARRGIKFEGKSNEQIIGMINTMFDFYEFDRVTKMLEVLNVLSEQKNYRLLSSAGYARSFEEKKDEKILRVCEYIMNNFTQGASLKEAARLANMNSSAFSRYFKRIQKKTFTRYLNEIKIGYACKLLTEQKYNISEVCYRSGFNNVSNFNRQFKALKEMTPSEYIKMHDTPNRVNPPVINHTPFAHSRP